MHRLCCVILLTLAMLALPAAAVEFSTKEQVIAMVTRVQEAFRKHGPEATFQAVNEKSNSDFHERDLYAFIYDMQGICVANGARPVVVGKNLISLKDQDGKYLFQEMRAIANGPGRGWLSYKWPSPITNKIQDRTAYIERMGDYFVGVGMDK